MSPLQTLPTYYTDAEMDARFLAVGIHVIDLDTGNTVYAIPGVNNPAGVIFLELEQPVGGETMLKASWFLDAEGDAFVRISALLDLAGYKLHCMVIQ